MARRHLNVPDPALDVEAQASVAAPSAVEPVVSGPGPVPLCPEDGQQGFVTLPTWTYRVFTIGGEVYESKVVNHKEHGVEVVLGSRLKVFIPYFGMDRIESSR